MSNRSTDTVFLLIKSLEKSEKRNFKLYVKRNSADTPLKVITLIQPHVLAKGGDYTIDTIVGADLVIQNGGEVKVIPFLPGHSTSAIEKKIVESKAEYRE